MKKVALQISNYRAVEPRVSNDMYAPPSGYQVAKFISPELKGVAKDVLSRALREQWSMPSEIPLSYDGKKYIARFHIHGPSKDIPQKHPGVGLYEQVDNSKQSSIGSKLDNNFFIELNATANRLGISPQDLMAVMHLESGFNPNASNPKSNAVGLTQIMPNVLSKLGWKGTSEDFGKLSGEEQLPYIEKYFKNIINRVGPVNSAAQLYIANLFPKALSNPGVVRGDPNAIIIDGIKDKWAYDPNKGLDIDKDGNITYGDILKFMNNIKSSSSFKQVDNRFAQAVGNESFKSKDMINDKPSEGIISSFLAKIEKILDGFLKGASQEHYLISINSNDDLCSKIEYASVLQTALKEELNIKSNIYANDDNVEMLCKVSVDKQTSDAIRELCSAVSNTFEYATKKIGGIEINQIVKSNIVSNYQELDINVAEINHRKFLLKFVKGMK